MELIIKDAIRIARLAGTKIKELRENKEYHEFLKDGYELVTSADLASNDIIKTEILKLYPVHHILSEEDKNDMSYNLQYPTWIVDPIDGTVGYAI